MEISCGGEDAAGEKIKAPTGFHPPDPDAFGQNHIKRDQKDIGHGQFADDPQGGQQAGGGEVEMDQRQTDGFQDRREQGQKADEEGKRDIGSPQ